MMTKDDMINHLIGRGMDPTLYPIAYSEEDQTITFLLFNGIGDLVGYQQYRPTVDEKKKKNDPKDGRYFTYLKNDKDGVFGWDLIDPSKRTIYVVEGVFKASVLHRLGFNAIAVLTSTPKRLKPWFRILRQTWNLIAIGDNDDAGQKLINIVGKGVKSPIDLDEMKDIDIIRLLSDI